MPAIVACAACQTKLKVPDNAGVKALRCPKCKGVVPIPSPNSAPPKSESPKPAPPKSEPPKAAPPPAQQEEEFEVNEAAPEQEEEFEVNEAAQEQEEEFEVNEAAQEDEEEDGDEEDEESEPEFDEDSALAELGFVNVKDIFKKGNIPDDARKAIQRAFTKKEKALWAGRPVAKIIESKAWIGLVVGPLFALLGVSICIGLSAFSLFTSDMAIKIIVGIVGVIFGVMFFGGGVAMVVFRKRIGGNAAACYVLTNKRAYIHDGTTGVRAFNAAQLQKMRAEESSKFEGAGDLVFAYDFMGQGLNASKEDVDRHGQQSTAVGFLAIENVQTVKRLIEEVLLEPALEKEKAKKKKKQKEKKNRRLFG